MTSQKSVLVTGAAGFIGFHLSNKLSRLGYRVTGIDSMNNYYDVNLKKSRLEILRTLPGFTFQNTNLVDQPSLNRLFSENKFDYVVNLAAQAGVRHSLDHPHAYLESNLHGFLNILEACRYNGIKHLIYASSSSVYGANTKLPFSVHQNVDHPISLYAASKKSNELMAHTYSALFKIPTTGLRFFSVYGPYGRPDMALFIFTKAILAGQPIDIFNHGKMKRDFTYVDDIVESIARLINVIPKPNPEWNGLNPDPATSFAPYRLFNIGNNQPVELMYYIELIEQKLGKKAIKNFLPLQIGDVPDTIADVSDLLSAIEFKPSTTIEEGMDRFLEWYLKYYNIKL